MDNGSPFFVPIPALLSSGRFKERKEKEVFGLHEFFKVSL
jgi:hypothetical protein